MANQVVQTPSVHTLPYLDQASSILPNVIRPCAAQFWGSLRQTAAKLEPRLVSYSLLSVTTCANVFSQVQEGFPPDALHRISYTMHKLFCLLTLERELID